LSSKSDIYGDDEAAKNDISALKNALSDFAGSDMDSPSKIPGMEGGILDNKDYYLA
jgi:hypothetical protein